MAYRKYDTCFFERYAMLCLQTLLGHKFDNLVNEDRPDLQSEDGHRLGIEVTRAMKESKDAAQQMLKDLAGIGTQSKNKEDKKEVQEIIDTGYGYGLQGGKYIGGIELNYWKTALPLKKIIRSKVSKVSSGFYGDFEEFGLYVFCKDTMTIEEVERTVRFVLDLQKDLEIKYSRLFLSGVDTLYACNLDDDIAFDYRISVYPIEKKLRKDFYLKSLKLEE